MKFTGERFIVGKAVGDITVEHLQRYKSITYIVKGKKVLDAACGEGYGSNILSQYATSVTGIDISNEAVTYAKEHYKRDNLKYICASIENIPLEDHSIDVIVSFETIEHVNADLQEKFLQEIKRVLKPDGILIMSSPDKRIYSELKNFKNHYHIHELYVEEFKLLLKKQFKYVELFSQGIGNQRIGVIEKIKRNNMNRIRLLNNFLLKEIDKQYVLAICSNEYISENMSQLLMSVMPFIPEKPIRIFVDKGNNFNENDVIVGKIKQENNIFKVKFIFDNDSKKIIRLRFDPTEKEGCICKIIYLKSNVENLTIEAVNKSKTSIKGDLFLTDDPQYIIKGNFDGIKEIEIKYIFEPISLDKIVPVLNKKINKNITEIKNKNEEIKNKNEEIKNKNEELQAIYNSKGYILLRKYYNLRDRMLPIGSNRRLVIKSIAKCFINFRYIKRFFNKNNIKKSIIILKKGGVRQLLVKFNDKMNRTKLKEKVVQNEYNYLNSSLKNNIIKIEDNNLVIDIIIPIYNAYDYTKKCIETVWKNTDINYNLYLINDCSTDKRIHELLISLSKYGKPCNLKQLNIIENETNLGFIESVNKAVALSKNNIVLLNTDTEVPPNWLSRLIYPMLKNEMIASITPFSNCATICSFPNFCTDNDLPKNISLDELDKLFSDYGCTQIIDIPTGVGFCMAMSRICLSKFGVLDIIYGKGYGEENDWCRRVAKNGYRNVMVTNLFVYHKHGASFSEQIDKSKQERIEENLIILTKRYPEYTRLVDEFIAKDPIKNIREFLYYIYLERINIDKEEGILFINHSCGGGATVYQDTLINKWKNKKRIYSIELSSDLVSLCFIIYRDKEKKSFYFNFKEMDESQFNSLIKAFNITYIYINQLVTYPIEKIINLIKATKLKYTFFIHDFYAVCPEYTLLNQNRVYCKAEKNIDKCNICLKEQSNIICKDIKRWRNVFHDFLLKANEVIAPSNSTARIINSYYSDVKIVVKEHSVPKYVHKTFNPEFLKKDILNIAVIGAIGEQKGSKIVYELVERIREEKLPINIKIIGITDLQNKYYKSKDGILEITGRYNKEEISDLLAKYQVGVVLIPSICPETYSYTTSEAIFSGYPVIVFNLGAPAERVNKLKCGWILNECKSQYVLDKIKHLTDDNIFELS